MEALDESIHDAEKTLEATLADDPRRPVRMSNLGGWLGKRFELTRLMDDLDRSIKVAQAAVDITPENHSFRIIILNNLANSLSSRFELTGSMEDLDWAIEIAEEIIDCHAQEEYLDRLSWLDNLGNLLGRRFSLAGWTDDIHYAVDVCEQTVAATLVDQPENAARQNNLATSLIRRYESIGVLDDLNRAIEAGKTAVRFAPDDHPDRPSFLGTLGNCIGFLFSRTGSIEDLNHAIEALQQAVDTMPEEYPHRATLLSMFSSVLGSRAKQSKSPDDLDRTVEFLDKAIDATPRASPDWAARVGNLSTWLQIRGDHTGSTEDIDRGIQVAKIAFDATDTKDVNRHIVLFSLGNSYWRRFGKTRSAMDQELSLRYYTEGWNCRTAPADMRAIFGFNISVILMMQSKWEDMYQVLQEAIQLLPSISAMPLRHSDKQFLLRGVSGLGSNGAAAALSADKDPYDALRLMESGRGIISGQLMDLRVDLSRLEQQHPELATEFISLRDELDVPASDAGVQHLGDRKAREVQAQRRRKAAAELSDITASIRDQPEFHDFLLPPSRAELMLAAGAGPIIAVNLGNHRSDAFLIEQDRIRVLSLPDLSIHQVQERIEILRLSSPHTSSEDMSSLLEWLWDTICCPVLRKLGFTEPAPDDKPPPRVRWMPTGALSQLPLHAAGYHTNGSRDTVLDRVVSSYTSSLKVLTNGMRRRDIPAKQYYAPPGHGLLVAMPQTPGVRAGEILPFVDDEVKMFTELCPSLALKLVTPAPLKEDVLQQLGLSTIFHFAGHGSADAQDPSRSCLLLKDWMTNPLTVEDVRSSNLQKSHLPFLAYLSACSTGSGGTEDLLDEGIHLVSAFQLAGFRHVVGSLWEVSDKHCVDIARILYETIRDEGMTDEVVCRGLHKAVRALRDDEVGVTQVRDATLQLISKSRPRTHISHHWIPFVHYGV